MCFDPVSMTLLATTALSSAAAAAGPVATAGAGLGAAGGLFSAVSAKQEGDTNAKIANANAAQAEAEGANQAETIASKYDRIAGSQRSAAAASGLNPDSGSAALIINQDTEKNKYLDTMSTLWNANSQAVAFKNDAAAAKAKGRNEMIGGILGAGGTLLGGLGKRPGVATA